jgi:DNA-binding XRE family transcriptional regulator
MPSTTRAKSLNRIERLRERLEMTQKVLARLLSVTERRLISLEHGEDLSDAVARRVTEIERLVRDLSKVIKPSAIGPWLTRPNDAFDGDVPADLIASGKVDLIWQMIYELRSGSAS